MTNPEQNSEENTKKEIPKPSFQISPLSEKPDIKNNKSETGDNISETDEKQNIKNQNSTNKKITLDEIIKKAEEENLSDSEKTEGDAEEKTKKLSARDLFLTKEFVEEVSEKFSSGKDVSEFMSQHGRKILTKNGFPEEEIEKMTSQEAMNVLREKIKEADRQNLSESEKKKEEEIQKALKQREKNTEQDAEKAGLQDRVRKIGESYNKVPLKYKFLIGAGLGVGSVALSGAAATGCMLCLFSQRVLGGAGTFVMVERLLQKAAEKGGRERGKWEKRRHAVEAAILGIAVGSKGVNLLNNDYISPINSSAITPLENAPIETGQDALINQTSHPSDFTEIPNETLTPEGINSPEIATPGIVEASIPQSDMTFTVGEETGTLWNGIEKTLQEQGYFNGLDEGRQTFLTDSIKDKFATMSPDELREIGISSGNISLVHPGETIDLSSVLENTASVEKLAEQVSVLPDSVSDQIWAQEHPNEALSGNKISDIVPSAPEINVTNDISANIENQNTPVESSFPETKITEGTPVLEPQPLEAHLLRENLNNLYGKLETNPNISGSESAHWDGEKGLSGQTIKTIAETNPNLLSSEGVGIESKEAVSATLEHIRKLTDEVRFTPKNNETIKEFFERAYSKIHN